jgi:hypothetical protein
MLIQIGLQTHLLVVPLHLILLVWQAGLYARILERSAQLHSLLLRQSTCRFLTPVDN